MSDAAMEAAARAIDEAMRETIAELGIEAVRALSWFPSARPQNREA